jgi:hypothetical protein
MLAMDFISRVVQVLGEEANQPEQFYYLSFAGATFHGAAVVKANGAASALLRANSLGINPGGEVLCVPIPENKVLDLKFCDRLLSKAEIMEMWGEPCKTIREWEAEDLAEGTHR